MKTVTRYQGRSVPGFTLVEIMVVIAIIAVLATMTVGGLGWYKRKAAEGKTKVLVQGISRALEEYRLDQGFFPQGDGEDDSSEQVYIALYGDGILELNDNGNVIIGKAPNGKLGDVDDSGTTYLAILNPGLSGNKKNVDSSGGSYTIIDAWGEKLGYRHDPRGGDLEMMNPANDFDLWSLGLDGVGGPSSSNKKDKTDDIKNW